MTRRVREQRETFPGEPAEVPAARQYVREALAGLPRPIINDAALAVTELAANAIEHTASRGGKFTVGLTVTSEHVHVEVTDEGGTESVPLVQDHADENGRGLAMLAELGALHVEMVPGGGCCVTASIPRNPDPCTHYNSAIREHCGAVPTRSFLGGPRCRAHVP